MIAKKIAVRKLKDVCEIVSGSTPKSVVPEYWGGENKWVTPAELNEESFIVNDTVRHVTDLGIQKTGLKSFPAGTVLLSCRAPIGKTAIAGCEMYCNQGFKNLVCSSVIHNEYLYFFLRSKKEYLNSLGRGATFKEVSKSIVGDVEIPLPSIESQVKIANQMKKVVSLITKRRQQLEKLDTLVKSQFVEMFGDPVENPLGWPLHPLDKYIESANNGMARRGNDENGAIVLRLVELQAGYLDLAKPNRIIVSEQEHKKFLLHDNDILFARVNGNPEYVGRCAVFHDVNEPVYHNDHIIRVHIKNLNPVWLTYIANSSYGRQQLRQYVKTSAGQYTISQDGIRSTKIIVPSPNLQNQFADFVTQIDKSKFAIQQSLDKLELLQRSLMNQYFG